MQIVYFLNYNFVFTLQKICFRREFFCDGYVNCAWPFGSESTDEQKNCDDLRNDLSASSTLFSPANIPVSFTKKISSVQV